MGFEWDTLLVRDWSGEPRGVQSDGQQEEPDQQPEQHGGAEQWGAGQHSSNEIRIFFFFQPMTFVIVVHTSYSALIIAL